MNTRSTRSCVSCASWVPLLASFRSPYLGLSGLAIVANVNPVLRPCPRTGVTFTSFPVQNAFQSRNAGGFDAFVVRLSASATILNYSTSFGGGGDDAADTINLENDTKAYMC